MRGVMLILRVVVTILICPLMVSLPIASADQEKEVGFFQTDDRWQIGLQAELSYEYSDVSDTANKMSGGADDLYLSSVVLSVTTLWQEWLETNIVAGLEHIQKKDESSGPLLDEAIVAITPLDFPFYAVIGKRIQPFGLMENKLISDSITEELYEIDTEGITIGVGLDSIKMDLSFTAYDEQCIIKALDGFGAHDFSSSRSEIDDNLSYIINLSFDFDEQGILLGLSYDSSPGDGRDNRTGSVGFALIHDMVRFDMEYGFALQREDGEDGVENLESAWSASISAEPLEDLGISFRYEWFDDDRDGQQDEVMERRMSAGLSVCLFDALTLLFEYRYTNLEREPGSQAADRQNEIFVELALEF